MAAKVQTLKTVRFEGLNAANARASRAAQGSSRKTNTRCERLLRKELFRRGFRFRVATDLAGKPDIVFRARRVVVFCDGDFWHGRNLAHRIAKLKGGHNAPYWVAKIEGNVARDARRTAELIACGWTVLRFWETDILRDCSAVADKIEQVLTAHVAT